MSKIQEMRTCVFTREGKKKYQKHFIIIPKLIMKVLRLGKGDDIVFDFENEDLIRGFVKFRKRKNI